MKPLYSVQETARLLGCSQDFVRRCIERQFLDKAQRDDWQEPWVTRSALREFCVCYGFPLRNV